MMGLLGIRQHGARGKELVATLSAQERCDRCPAAGHAVVLLKMRVSKVPADNVLVFCKHHLNQHEPALAAAGASIYRKED
jgi:hypothetical protein